MIKRSVGLCAIVFVALGVLANASPLSGSQRLLGAKECTWGPSYWCGNLTNAKACNAVRHCIQTIWERQNVPVDNDSICQICKDMVTQARDQLRSNETMEELKEVFEGSCNLIPIKVVKKECCKLADDFVPELVEALSSQMNPDQVCSVAGLCNNAEIDEKLMEYYRGALDGTLKEEVEDYTPKKAGCDTCKTNTNNFIKMYNASKSNDVKKTFLRLCDQLPAFKDCSNIVRTHFNTINDYLRKSLDARTICILTGNCYTNYQGLNEKASVETETELANYLAKADGDSDCKFCKHLSKQIYEVLIAKSTVDEFKLVLRGFCSSNNECQEYVDQYYAVIYNDLKKLKSESVCSTIGVCSNLVNIEYGLTNECDDCKKYGKELVDKFKQSDPADMKEKLLHWCGGMSTYSVGCSNIITSYFSTFYDYLNKHLSADGLCHLSGFCVVTYHNHPDDEKPKNELGTILKKTNKDDIPCELCQQLVKHLRDVLVANTTEEEFKMVLDGFCGQTQGFKKECMSIVDQYYDEIYKTLVNNLDSNGVCVLMGVCPKIAMPMLPVFPPAEIKITIKKKLGANEPKFTEEDLGAMLLPIDRLMGAPNPNLLVENGELCTICEYVLHFIQEALATPSTDDEIKHEVENICKLMPNSIRGQCHNFIDMYGDAVIALLIQGLDPRTICPKMQMCPPNKPNHDDMEVFKPATHPDESDKPTCPLCLFAVEQAQEKIKNDKSKKNIKNVLDHLCVHLPEKLQAECIDFVDTYSGELIDMLITDFKPQEICVALKLCPKSNSYLSDLGISLEDDESNSSSEELFNEIERSDDLPLEIVLKQDQDSISPNCWLCEEFVKNAEKRINKKMSKAEIEKVLQHSCDKLRKSVQPKCHKYVDKYGDKIATLLLKEMEPKMICRELGLCLWSEQEDLEIDEALKYDVIAMPNEKSTSSGQSERLTGLSAEILNDPPTCVLCEFVMTKLEAELKDKTEQDEIKRAIEKICDKMPKTVAHSCDKFVEQYANAVIALIGSVPPEEICKKLQLCPSKLDAYFINDEVIECGVCHGASMALLPFFRDLINVYEVGVHDMVSVGCEKLPAKYYERCSNMIAIYGQSILHLSQKSSELDETHVCIEIGKCFDNEKSALAFAKISD